MAFPTSHRFRWALGVVLAVALGIGAGCGYRPVRQSGAFPGASTLAIQPIENGTFEPGVETVVLDALRREALSRGGLRLVEDAETADVVIGGRVRTLNVSARSFTSVVLSVEYEVSLGLDLIAFRRNVGPIPLDSRAQFEQDRFLASADNEAMRKNRREAIHRLAGVLADRVYDSLYASAQTKSASGPATP